MSVRLIIGVIGAGPAGLLFACVTRLLAERRGIPRDQCVIALFDKRAEYVRTHRLRLDAESFEAIGRDLAASRFDMFVQWLRRRHFRPEVNLLEDQLLALAVELGIGRTILTVGDAPGEVGLITLAAQLRAAHDPAGTAAMSLVAADSVRSTVRRLAVPTLQPARATHQHVARLRVEGDALPGQLGVVDQLRLSKVLGSIVDYRLNTNGFCEVDLCLPEAEHTRIAALGASPGAPVDLTRAVVRQLRAPLFQRVVGELSRARSARASARCSTPRSIWSTACCPGWRTDWTHRAPRCSLWGTPRRRCPSFAAWRAWRVVRTRWRASTSVSSTARSRIRSRPTTLTPTA